MKVLAVLLFTGMAFGQVTIKPSPASDALNTAAKELTAGQKSLETITQQARAVLESQQKDIQKQLQDTSKALNEKLKEDKKYKPDLDKIDTLTKQLQTLQSNAEKQYTAQAGPIQQKVATDNALVNGLTPVVKKENSLPDSATYDAATQTWKAK
jgi:septal ring factor EnvC (AmiA/AmiB activator)